MLDIINDTKKSANIRSGEFYLDAVEQAIAKEMMIDPTFKAKECMIKEDGNLLCSELGFNNCETNPNFDLNNVINPFICSGTEKEIKVDTTGEKPTEGIIKLNNGNVEESNLTISNNSLVMKENNLVSKNDTEVIYEADYILGDGNTYIPYIDIKELDYNSLYNVNVSIPILDLNLSSRAIAGEVENLLALKPEPVGAFAFTNQYQEGFGRTEGTIKIEKLNEVVDYGFRITKNNSIYFYSKDFDLGPVNFFIQTSEGLTAEICKDNFKKLEFKIKFGNYVLLEFKPYTMLGSVQSETPLLKNIAEERLFYIIVMQEIDGETVIRRYGGTKPTYQETHIYDSLNESYYWGSDFYPGFSE